MVFIFLRDDDVFKQDKELDFIFRFFINNKIKCSFSIIPGVLEKSTVNFFYRNIKYSYFFDILQHGYKHVENKHRIEFGKGIDFKFQYKNIKKGFKIIQANFKSLFAPVYVPPFHNYDCNTLKAIYKVGHKAITASRMIKRFNNRLKFFRCNINVNIYKENKVRIDVDFLKNLTISKIRTKEIIGIYFHHITLNETENFYNFIEYIFFLKWLEKKNIISFVKISDLL